jgi:hypothetical protein
MLNSSHTISGQKNQSNTEMEWGFMKLKATTHRVISTLQSLTVVGHSTSLVPTVRSQHFSLSFQFGHSTSLVLRVRSQHFSLPLQFGHSTSVCPQSSVITLLLSSQLCYSTSPFPTINTTTAIKIITKLLSVIPVFQIWCFCTSFLVLC